MKLIVNNLTTQAVIGGKDNLLPIDLRKELREYLRARPEGYNFSPMYRPHPVTGKRRWDGWRNFINEAGYFATGFLPFVAKLLEDLKVSCETIDERGEIPAMKETLNLQVGVDTLAEHQARAVEKVRKWVKVGNSELYFPRGIVSAATNAGKTHIIAGIHNNTVGARSLVTIHNQLIFDQMVEFFTAIYGPVGTISASKMDINPTFTIAMAKTLLNRSESMNVKKELAKFNCLYVDEAHRSGGPEYSKLLQRIPAPVRVFVSGTALENHDKVKNMIIVGLSGPTLLRIENKELIEKKWSRRPVVTMVLNDSLPMRGKLTYDEEVQQIMTFSHHKNRLLGDLIKERPDKQIIVAFEFKAHGYFMYDYISQHPEIFGVVDITHGTDKEKSQKLKDFKEGKINVLFSSLIIKEGLNIPSVQTLILTLGGKSVITSKQLPGRGMRRNGVDEELEILDFYDVGAKIGKHSRDRIRIYKREGFEVKSNFSLKEAIKLCR